jgi:serine/threonine-protein kinase
LLAPDTPEPRSSQLPTLDERFDAIEFIGEGAMGTVYRARDRRLGREVAIKVIHGSNADAERRFLSEARAQARVQHENICKIYEASSTESQRYIVMQFINGKPLDKAKEGMTTEQKVKAVAEAAAALHEAHRIGLIHRDIKPGNIMVERGDDGEWKPYVMDFGLAREMDAHGETMSGIIMGTPSFMAPEQARGEIQALDRRTDVYSLGATLYDLLGGRPPFSAPTLWELLQRVGHEDAPPLREVNRVVAVDLETVVMKCLEREPNRRYESAKALADDLRRYLDDEPVMAHRASVAYLMRKKIRKHKIAVAFGSAALVATLIVATLWIRAARIAAEQARLSRELGEDVKEMELFLRSAYGLPLHNVERERDVIRARLGKIEKTAARAGESGRAPGDYALGRGYLALQEPEKARELLERAEAGGYTSPELDYALGRALGEVYRKELAKTKQIQNKEERAAAIQKVEVSYRGPALIHLGAARGAMLESPAYVEGLIAFYGGRYEEALGKAREATEETPWLYEAKKLEGDALRALGSQYDISARFDWDKMMAYMKPAAEAYRVAAETARSDPEVHLAACELWANITQVTLSKGEPLNASLSSADETCARAIQASPRDGRAQVQRARAHVHVAFAQAGEFAPSDDPRRSIEEAVRFGEEAVRASPEDAEAHNILAFALEADVACALRRGDDAQASLNRAMRAAEEALRINPRFLMAMMHRARFGYHRIELDRWRGVDVLPTMEEHLRIAERVIALDPSYSFAWQTKAALYYFAASAIVEQGQSPEDLVKRALATTDEVERLNPSWSHVYTLKSWCHLLLGLNDIHTGRDPRRSLEEAMRCAEKAEQRNRESSPLGAVSDIYYAEALYLLQQRAGDPQPALRKAREMSRRAIEKAPWSVEKRVKLARAEILNLRWAMDQRAVQPAMFEEALALASPFASEELKNPAAYKSLAEIHALRAAWLVEGKKSPEDEIKLGLANVDKALAINPRMASALATKASLHLTQARATRDPSARAEAARLAQKVFEDAFKSNPLLEREHGAALQEAARLR